MLTKSQYRRIMGFMPKGEYNRNKPNNMNLTITKEKVLEAAGKCSQAKATLEVLFPEVFKKKYTVDDMFREIRFTCPNEDNTIEYRIAYPINGQATVYWQSAIGRLESSNF